jgi:glycosyltransferase involved in cell wall biosynthesis
MISIIIPTYNRAERLKDTIDSVFAQTQTNWELVVVDDGSTDDTEKVVRSFDDDRIHYIKQDNRGVSAARNVGIANARGELIAFLDSDDRWKPRKLEVQKNFFDSNPDAHICQTEEVWVRNGVRVNPKKKHAKPSGWIFKECIPLCCVSPSSVMMRREIFDTIGIFDESLPACEDYDLWLRASLHYEIVTLPDPLTIKIGGHDDQLSRQPCLDIYRIQSLKKLLDNPALVLALRPLVEADIERRGQIVKVGAQKRSLGF